jgi:predicted HAD superfamily Cof-like phosphohydrolase
MRACDQTVGEFNQHQFDLYVNLMEEEAYELADAIDAHDRTEILDALLDSMVVTIGALHSLGVDAEGAWHEVMRSNLSKIDHATGRVRKREDGKVLKPVDFVPPQLKQFVK